MELLHINCLVEEGDENLGEYLTHFFGVDGRVDHVFVV